MATSPRTELVIESVTTFAKLGDAWVWSESDCASSTVSDSGHGAFYVLDDAVRDFFEDKGIDFATTMPAEDAHYSELHKVTDDQYEIRKYKFGAPDPMQAVTNV